MRNEFGIFEQSSKSLPRVIDEHFIELRKACEMRDVNNKNSKKESKNYEQYETSLKILRTLDSDHASLITAIRNELIKTNFMDIVDKDPYKIMVGPLFAFVVPAV